LITNNYNSEGGHAICFWKAFDESYS
jgi:hypothetical protein